MFGSFFYFLKTENQQRFKTNFTSETTDWKDKRSDLSLASKPNSHLWSITKFKHKKPLKLAENQSAQSFEIKTRPISFRILRFKNNAKSWGGAQNFKKFGENGCGCNNWRSPGEPRSLGDCSLSDKLFNNKCIYWILLAIWISQMTEVCTFNHWW